MLVLPIPTVKIPTKMIPTLSQSFCEVWLSQFSFNSLVAEHTPLESSPDPTESTTKYHKYYNARDKKQTFYKCLTCLKYVIELLC